MCDEKQFTALVIFGDLDAATNAEFVLHAAGYSTKILADTDLYSQSAWMDVWRPTEADNYNDPRFDLECDRLRAIVDPLEGCADEYGVVGHGELPRESAFSYEIDEQYRYVVPDASYVH